MKDRTLIQIMVYLCIILGGLNIPFTVFFVLHGAWASAALSGAAVVIAAGGRRMGSGGCCATSRGPLAVGRGAQGEEVFGAKTPPP